MNLIIETDIGHDPDDLFAICYLIAAGVNICAINVVPGDPDQIAIAKFIRDACKLDFPIGASKLDREKLSSGSIHHQLLKKYKLSLEAKPDGYGPDIVKEVHKKFADCELFVIGPVSSTGKYLKETSASFPRATMQGGFLPYSLYEPIERLEKFEGQEWIPTFNLNGDRKAGEAFINADIKERRFVGKNLCHTIVYDKTIHDQFWPNTKFSIDAAQLFVEASAMYLEKHENKKFHDPTAAVCHLHPEIATWFPGKPVKMKGGWTTQLVKDDYDESKWEAYHQMKMTSGEGEHVAADIDREKLWHYLTRWR